MKPNSAGLTLIEIMVVMAILAVLITMGWMAWQNQINKARDADRKADLQRIQVAFEDYYNDYNCYPPATILSLDTCPGAGDQLKPYLSKIPCDSVTHQPYYLQLSDCFSYRILTHLDNNSDSIINSLNCNPDCGYGSGYNYGVASTNVSVSAYGGVPLPSGYSGPGKYGCQTITECNDYISPENAAASCPFTFNNNYCDNACSNPIYLCNE